MDKKIKDSQNEELQVYIDHLLTFNAKLSTEGIVLYINKTAVKAIGCIAEEIVGKYFWNTPWWNFDKKLQERLKSYIVKARKGNVVVVKERIAIQNGFIDIQFTLNPVFNKKRNVIYLVAEGQDITNLSKAKLELEKKLNEINKMNQLMIGRELKMIELKKKIKELERESGKAKEK